MTEGRGIKIECYGFVGSDAQYDAAFRGLTHDIISAARHHGFAATATFRIEEPENETAWALELV